jgi:hypothetical protein
MDYRFLARKLGGNFFLVKTNNNTMKNLFVGLFLLALSACYAQVPAVPSGFVATAYESHVELTWDASSESFLTGYRIYRAPANSSNFTLLKQIGKFSIATDWTGDEGQNLTFKYKIQALSVAGSSNFTEELTATTHPMSDEELLEMTQRATFRYFWDFGHPVSGMSRERNNGDNNVVTSGGTGFGIMALIVGAERGWVSRTDAANRMKKIVYFLKGADRFHGAFSHWINGNSGKVVPFSQYDNGGDLVETAFLIQGLLAARKYFNENNTLETDLRDNITQIWEAVEWDWYRKNGSGVLYWHWSPNYGGQMNFPLRGFYEAQIVYILAAASPTHGVPGSLYQTGWTSTNYANNGTMYGYKIYCGPFGGGPMFWAHYSYLGFDPRGLKDAFCNYFVRNRNHALIQNAYSVANPENHLGYAADCWGLTSCDSPNGYAAHDVRSSQDDGTIAPTAALASMPYTPAESIAALRHFYRQRGATLWGVYGFYDAFNRNYSWTAPSYLAIDQGPIIAMIENYRTGLIWRLFMENTEILPALFALGFSTDNSETDEQQLKTKGFDVSVYPNPVPEGQHDLHLQLSLLSRQQVVGNLLDINGRHIKTIISASWFEAGIQDLEISLLGLAKGTYFIEISTEKGSKLCPIICQG